MELTSPEHTRHSLALYRGEAPQAPAVRRWHKQRELCAAFRPESAAIEICGVFLERCD